MSRPLEPDLGRLEEDLEALSTFREPRAPGWTRRVFSPLDREARELVAETMTAAGLEVSRDAAANLIGVLPGTSGDLGALVTGSHTDTVHGGGRFDGIAGVLGAIEAVRCLNLAGIRLRHDLVVVDFLGEEPNDFGLSCVGSHIIAGQLRPEHLQLRDPSERTLEEALREAGADPDALASARWEPARVHCYVELHIEQGPFLEAGGVPIGVVTAIAGIHRLRARLEGRPDHSGTTPMATRRDALCGAAEAVLVLERLAAEGGVSTTGRLDIDPGALNIVPAVVEMWAEARSSDGAWLDDFVRRFEAELAELAARRHLDHSTEWLSKGMPVAATEWVAGTIDEASAETGLESMRLPSGAGHDAAPMASLGPMGMIFVPSRDGRSHCPEEWTDLEQIGDGVTVLVEALRRLDAASGPRG